jgi:molybdenum cofactor synthesis domain-containing protein
MGHRVSVITVSDGVSAGEREDGSGEGLQQLLEETGYEVSRRLVPDDVDAIRFAIKDEASRSHVVLTTGGTGFGLRDVTPEATGGLLDREAPGLVHVMVAKGLESTPMAALTRAKAGTMGDTLVVNLPGSPVGAVENLEAILDLVPHILQLLSGDNAHH